MNRRHRSLPANDGGIQHRKPSGGVRRMREEKITIAKRLQIERFSVVSPKPFEAGLAALKAAVGNPDRSSSVRRLKRRERSLNSKMSFAKDWERQD